MTKVSKKPGQLPGHCLCKDRLAPKLTLPYQCTAPKSIELYSTAGSNTMVDEYFHQFCRLWCLIIKLRNMGVVTMAWRLWLG